MEMTVKTMERAARSAGRRRRRRRRGELLPHRRHHGRAPPLSLLHSWLLGIPPPWRWDPWRRLNMALVAANLWVEEFSTS